jgi:hypothetical protein|nr:MAG TPA: hypothetical protein [Caudoviricetes sp.]
MKRCHFNSWVAKVFLFSDYKAITFLYNSFFKDKVEDLLQEDIDHERTHQVQQFECTIVGVIIGLLLWSLGLSFWCIPIFGLGLFYFWYGIEYFIIMCFAGWDKQNERYHDVSFEEEAYNNDKDPYYLEYREHFAWFRYIKLRSYKK